MPYLKIYHYTTKEREKNTIRKWVKNKETLYNNNIRKKGKDIYSSRFGYLNLYGMKEQQNLICPSGYSISQCFNKLRFMWMGYKRAKREKKIDRMKKYALEIQSVQKDMGIETASFPFLGIFGDKFVLYDKKSKELIKEDHSKYVKAQKMKQIIQEVAKDEEIQTMVDDKLHDLPDIEATVPLLVQPAEDEQVLIMADEIPFQKCPICEKCGAYMPFDKKHECPDELEILSDNIPFRTG